jgi:anti-sigma factor RsiW
MTEPDLHPSGEELSSYLDGALRPGRALEVEVHLSRCGRCRQELSALRAAKAAVADLPPPEPRPGWLAQVHEAGTARFGPARHRRVLLRRGAAVAGVAAVGLGVGLWIAPPPEAPVTFQDEVRQHLVQIDQPLSDQTSYVFEVRYP